MSNRRHALVAPLTTKIVVSSADADHPYCNWPSPEISTQGVSDEDPSRTLFAVQTWDGRELLAVDVPQVTNE